MRIYFFMAIIFFEMSIDSLHADDRLSENNSVHVTRFMSYNIRRDGKEKTVERSWHNRLSQVLALINEYKPDLIGLQEAKQNQIDDLIKGMSDYSFFGEGRGESWLGWGENEHCPILYNAKKYTLLESGTFSINPTNTVTWLFDITGVGLLPRICSYGKFEDNQTHQLFYLYNTHLDHKFSKAQLHGLKVIQEHINAQVNDLPVIITGDFNTDLTDSIKNILARFVPAKEVAQTKIGPDETRTGWQDNELKCIDHILVSRKPASQVLLYQVIESSRPYPSDHRPVVADVVLP